MHSDKKFLSETWNGIVEIFSSHINLMKAQKTRKNEEREKSTKFGIGHIFYFFKLQKQLRILKVTFYLDIYTSVHHFHMSFVVTNTHRMWLLLSIKVKIR